MCRVPTDQPAPVPPCYTASSRHSNLLASSRCIAGSNIHARVVKQLPWPRKIPLRIRTFALSSYFLACKQSRHVTIASPSFGTSWITRLLQGSSFLMKNCSVWTSTECVLSIFVELKLHFLPIDGASFKFFYSFLLFLWFRKVPVRLTR